MLDLKPIVQAILKDYALSLHGPHGVGHWARVLENGLRLAELTEANADAVRLFAIFHDSRRMNESTRCTTLPRRGTIFGTALPVPVHTNVMCGRR